MRKGVLAIRYAVFPTIGIGGGAEYQEILTLSFPFSRPKSLFNGNPETQFFLT